MDGLQDNSMSNLVLIRHGQSTYNLQNRFTGWKDVPLTDKGISEAVRAGKYFKEHEISFDLAYTSNLSRAQHTLDIIMQEMDVKLEVIKNTALNERDYGDLIGQNKAEAAKEFGKEQVQIWRRSYDTPPPGGESLKMTCNRTLPYFKNNILPRLKKQENIILSAHGNSIRAIVKYLFNYDSENILKTEIGWCEPWCFTFDKFGNVSNFELLIEENQSSNSNIPFIPNFKELVYE